MKYLTFALLFLSLSCLSKREVLTVEHLINAELTLCYIVGPMRVAHSPGAKCPDGYKLGKALAHFYVLTNEKGVKGFPKITVEHLPKYLVYTPHRPHAGRSYGFVNGFYDYTYDLAVIWQGLGDIWTVQHELGHAVLWKVKWKGYEKDKCHRSLMWHRWDNEAKDKCPGEQGEWVL
jgi:hypothetical protein